MASLYDELLSDYGLRKQSRKPSLEELLGEDTSILSSIGSTAMVGIEYLSGSLGKAFGGRAIRGLLGGKPREALSIIPFSDTLGITDPRDEVSGRDLLGENTPGFDALDVPGFALDVLLDPGTYIGGIGLVGKGAKIAQKAGLASKVGKAENFATSSLDDLLRNLGPEATQAAERAAGGASELARVSAEPMGYGISFGLPFMEPAKVINSPTLARVIDEPLTKLKGIPVAGKAFDYLVAPAQAAGRQTSALFDPSVYGTTTPEVQKHARSLYETVQTGTRNARAETARELTELSRAGLTDQDYGNRLRAIGEGVEQATTPLEMDFLSRLDAKRTSQLDTEQLLGAPGGELLDPAGIGYVPRQLGGTKGQGRNYRDFGASAKSREDWTRGWRGGTGTLNRMLADDDILNAADDMAASRVIAQKYGQDLVGKDKLSVMQEAARAIRAMPAETRQYGFGNHVLFDLQNRDIASVRKVGAANMVSDVFAEFGKPSLAPGERGKPLKEIAETLGFEPGDSNAGFYRTVLSKMGLDPADSQAFFDAPNLVLPENIADDLVKFHDNFSGPKATGELVKALDSFTNTFKAGMLTWPSRFVRDFVSGQSFNFLTGNANLRSVTDAVKLARGQLIDDAHTIPLVRDTLKARGLPLDAQHGTDVVREFLYADGIGGAFQGERSAANTAGAGNIARGSADELFGSLVGTRPYSANLFRKQANDSLNPLALRGVQSKGEVRQATTFYPARVGEDVGAFVESMNRVPAYLYNLRQGADRAYAKQVTDALQVNYRPENFTRTEQDVLLRAFPFYKWTRKILPTLFAELATNPRGGVRQLMRLLETTSSDQEFTPEYLQGGINIPLGQNEDGTQRYVTQSGLPVEALNLFHFGTGGLKKTGLNVLGMMNPLVKAPLEQMTGRQFYSDRDLRDLDPRSGRILETLGLVSDSKQVPQVVDQLLMNSPASRIVSTVGQGLDMRKGAGAKALNLFTGLRISDVDVEKQKRIAAREALNEALRGMPGVGFYESAYQQADAPANPEVDQLFALLQALQRESQRKKAG